MNSKLKFDTSLSNNHETNEIRNAWKCGNDNDKMKNQDDTQMNNGE